MQRHMRRAAFGIVGGVLVATGLAMVVLPGPGLLVVLDGLVVLSREFPALERHVDPVRDRALKAAEDSVSTPLRLVASVLFGLALTAAGVIWTIDPWELPLGGPGVGLGLVFSGLALLVLLVYSYRRTHHR